MSADRFTEVTSQSWFSRIGGAIKGVVIGLVLFLVAFPLLFWNEGRAVKQYKTLKEGGGVVVSVAANEVDTANAGKLVHVTGKASTDATLADAAFGVSVNAIKLRRVVEMYQWSESSRSKEEKEVGGGTETTTTYTYSKTWSDRVISSADFKEPAGHQNPGAMPYMSIEQVADGVSVGAFTLPAFLVDQINRYEPLPISSDTKLPEAVRGKAKVHDSGLYMGADPASPQVGDVRIRFAIAKPGDVSVIARQVGNTFEPYQTKAGGNIGLLKMGVLSAETMIQQAQASNKVLTWILRLVGFILMLIGLSAILKPLSVLADFIPFLGNIVGAGTGLIAFLLAGVLSLITIAVAWIVFRPLIGILLIVATIGLIVLIKGRLKAGKVAARK
jgi:hypothetical protein